MDKAIYTFEPFKQSTDWVLVITVSLIIGMILGTWLLNKYVQLDTTRRNIIIMVCFFVGIIAAGTALFRLISLWKLKPVQIYNNRIETPYGTAQFNNIRDFYVKIERHYKPMNPEVVTDSARYFFLIERNDKTHVLSEGDYAIDSVLAKLNDVMGY